LLDAKRVAIHPHWYVGSTKNPKRRGTRLRDPEHTRGARCAAAFREVYRSGFPGASLDAVLAAAGVTNSALYYHFDGKEASFVTCSEASHTDRFVCVKIGIDSRTSRPVGTEGLTETA
jgi:AcrR family transcriptional regulator